jgi:hypothetical protein
MADKTSDPLTLKAALGKIEEHNKSLTYPKKPKRFNWGIFSTHPRTNERPLKPNQFKDASVAGVYMSFLVATCLTMQIFLYETFSSATILWGVLFFLSVTLLGTAFVVIEYGFISRLTTFFAEKFDVKFFYPNNVLNGIVALILLMAFPLLTGTTNFSIIAIFTTCAIITAIFTAAIGTSPFKKGLLTSGLSWLLNTAIFIATYIVLRVILFSII